MAGELNWDELLKVDAGSWFSGAFKGEKLALLSDVAQRCREHRMMANIEIKPTTGTDADTGRVVALAARALWSDMTAPLLSSFSIEALEAAQQAAPELPRGLLLDEWRDDWQALTTRLGCVSIHLNHKLLDQARVAQLKDAGLRILVYTVNSPRRALELLAWGVDCICTDAIDVIGPNFTVPFWRSISPFWRGSIMCVCRVLFSVAPLLLSMCCELPLLLLSIPPLVFGSTCSLCGFSIPGWFC